MYYCLKYISTFQKIWPSADVAVEKLVVVGKFGVEKICFRKFVVEKKNFGKFGAGKSVSENSVWENLFSENSPDIRIRR